MLWDYTHLFIYVHFCVYILALDMRALEESQLFEDQIPNFDYFYNYFFAGPYYLELLSS